MVQITSESEARDYTASLCDAQAMERLDRFVASLIVESARQNLIARSSAENIWQRHIADSAQLLEFISGDPELWLDLGTGAGLPGLVIAAMRPDWPVILVESRRKRIDWLQACIGDLDLTNCQVEGHRLEKIEAIPASIISARAFAPLDRLLKLSTRFSTGDTLWLLPKGRSAAQELQNSLDRIREVFHVKQSRTDSEAGIIYGRLAAGGRRMP